jgi:hypothetical protein
MKILFSIIFALVLAASVSFAVEPTKINKQIFYNVSIGTVDATITDSIKSNVKDYSGVYAMVAPDGSYEFKLNIQSKKTIKGILEYEGNRTPLEKTACNHIDIKDNKLKSSCINGRFVNIIFLDGTSNSSKNIQGFLADDYYFYSKISSNKNATQ